MIELRLRSGQIVGFDGRVLELFPDGRPSERVHVAQVAVSSRTAPDGSITVEFGDSGVALSFTREEQPACARLLAAIADSTR